jgi:hypothetical protein
MNETDNPRSERRRPSRGRRRRSGGGDRSQQAQQPGGSPAQKPPSAPNPPRANKSPRQNEKQARGKDRAARRDDAPKNGGSQRPQRRQDKAETAKSAAQAAPQRERFSAPRISAPTLPKPVCPRCGMPIEDLPSALNDKETGAPIHFDCVLARISEGENLGEGEKVVYLGGGRFGVVQFDNPGDAKRFRVKKTVQWEEKEKRADWRRQVADLYSAT